MTKPMISIVIPTYHRNELLKKCLECLVHTSQTLSAELYEVIITDDGQQTTAQNLVENEFSNFQWVEGPRKGPAANRNNGVKHAHGEYIVFTDDDCLPDINWLAAYAEALCTNVAVYEGKTICKEGLSSPLQDAPINESGGYLWSCNMMVKKDIFVEVGGFDESYPYPAMEDSDLRQQLKSHGYSFIFVKDAIVDHPPRQRIMGLKLGKYWESNFYFVMKWNKSDLDKRLVLISMLFNHNIRKIKKVPFCRELPYYLSCKLIESTYVILNVNSWFKKYNYRLKHNNIK